MDLEELITLAKRNPVIVVWLALMLFGTIARKLAGKKEDAGAQGGRGGAAPRAAPTDLEGRIRRNFEEMLRRRASGGASTAGAQEPAAAAARRPAPPKAHRNYDEDARKEPVQVRVVRPEPTRVRHAPAEATPGDAPVRRRTQLTAPRTLALRLGASPLAAKGALVRRITRSSVTRRVLHDRAALRRAIVLKEVLGPPCALRDD